MSNGADRAQRKARDGKRELAPGYSEEDIANGLFALAMYNGSERKASRHLVQEGRKIPASTLQHWKHKIHVDRYEKARQAVRDRVWNRMSDKWRQSAETGAAATLEATEKGRKAVEDGDVKRANEWASTARNFATAGGISNDRAGAVDGRPTEIIERRDAAELVRALQSRFGGLVKVENLEERDGL